MSQLLLRFQGRLIWNANQLNACDLKRSTTAVAVNPVKESSLISSKNVSIAYPIFSLYTTWQRCSFHHGASLRHLKSSLRSAKQWHTRFHRTMLEAWVVDDSGTHVD